MKSLYKVLHCSDGKSDKVYIITVQKNSLNKYDVRAYYGRANSSNLKEVNKGMFGSQQAAINEMHKLAQEKDKKGYEDIKDVNYHGYLNLGQSDIKKYLPKKEDVKLSDLSEKEVIDMSMDKLVPLINYNFENEKPEDAYNEGLKLAKDLKSNNEYDKKIAVAKTIKRYSGELLKINPIHGESDLDTFESAIRLKAMVERGSESIKEKALEELKDRYQDGVQKGQSSKLHIDLGKKFAPKWEAEEILYIAICLNNIGMEESFDVGVGYCFEDETRDEEFIQVYNKTGKLIECDHERFKIEREIVED